MPLLLGNPLFSLLISSTELRFFHLYVPLADAKTEDYFVIFPVASL